jgi:hypothetical protein
MIIKQNPIEVEKKLRNMTDGIGMPLDEGAIRPCVILNSLGFKTRQSCSGHEDRYNTYPWIDLIWNEEETKEYLDKSLTEFFVTIYQDLVGYYKESNPKHDNVISFFIFDGEDQLIIRLTQLTDIKIFGAERPEKIREHFEEIKNFCEYLNKKYQLNY